MKSISMAWMTSAFLANRKSRTRREWNDDYAEKFKVGEVISVTDKQFRFGGKIIGYMLIKGIKKEDISLMPEEDYEKEGFKYKEEQGELMWKKPPRQAFEEWCDEGGEYWVIDFQRVQVFSWDDCPKVDMLDENKVLWWNDDELAIAY